MADNLYYCVKCNRTMNEDQFYGSNNLEKYPKGKLNQCKKCITMHVDNWNPETYLWILQECDVPYIPDEWNKLLTSYAQNKTKLTGLTILGRYLSKMRLKQFRDYRWKDSEFLQEVANNRIETTMKRQGFDAQQIADAINKATFDLPAQPLVEPQYAPPTNPYAATGQEDYFADQTPEEDMGLTEEDITYLRLKWGKTYKPEEWVALERLYEEMMQSYDIQTAGHIDTLKLICKTSLKANQLIDIGDVEGFQKMSKVYDSLMKSGNFTAVQNKNAEADGIDSIGEIVALCEKDSFIAKYYIDQPNDKVDRTIMDMQQYTRDLVVEELGLGGLIENAIKALQEEKTSSDSILDDDTIIEEAQENKLFDYSLNSLVTDEDMTEFRDFEDELEDEDEALLASLLEENR